MVWLLVGYMWLFLHRPFEVWPILGAIRLERVYMLFTMLVWATTAKKEWTENRVNFALCAVAFSITFSTVMSPYVDILNYIPTQDWLKVFIFYLLIMSTVKKEKDLKILTTAFIVCFFLYMLHSFREYQNGKGKWAMDTWRMVGVDSTMNDPNTFGNSIVYALPMLYPLMALFKKKWHWLFLAAYFLLSFRCVQLTGSRSSMLAIGFLLGSCAVASKHRAKIVPTMALCIPLIWFSMNENLKDRYRTIWNPSSNKGATDSALGRVEGFWGGIRNFENSPIWGIGPECHPFTTPTKLQTHQLYGQIIGELGLIGIFAFLSLLGAILFNHWEIIQLRKTLRDVGREKDADYCYRVSGGVVITVFLLLLLGLGGHNMLRYTWVWYAAFQGIAVSILREKVAKVRFAKMTGIDIKTLRLN
ncbi:MAG TPA: hypothetical protein DEB39_13765 [Planctomycetaceae bacterium]|nr:hypothetical protein [Planctomycetaceae bacterium]